MRGVLRHIFLVGLCCLPSEPARASPPWNVTELSQTGGLCFSVQVVGRYAYLGEGANLTVLDVANPSSPVQVGQIPLNDLYVGDLQVMGGFAYLAGAGPEKLSGLQIVDVTNPRSPRCRTFYSVPFGAHGVSVVGNLACVAWGDGHLPPRGGVQLIDVSNLSSPTLRGSYNAGDYVSNVYVSSGTAYVAADDGLHILDVTNPSLPKRVGFYSQNECHDVFVSGGLAYTAMSGCLEIVDVTHPTTPTRRGKLSFTPAYGLSLSDKKVFLALQNSHGLGIVDVSNPSSPTLLGSCPLTDTAWAVDVSSGTAYVAGAGEGLSIVDITNPAKPTLRASFDTLSGACDVCVAGTVAYVTDTFRGLKTFDVSNPTSPRILGSLVTPGRVAKITVSNGIAYISGVLGPPTNCRGLLHIADVRTPSSPKWLGSYDTKTTFALIVNVAVSGGFAYLTDVAGLRIVDVSKPTSPTLRASFKTKVWADGVFVSDGLAYVADYGTLQIIDVHNPAAPFLRSSFPASPIYRITDVIVSNGIAYLNGVWNASGTPGDFACVDVRNPDAPKLLGTYDIAGSAFDSREFAVSNGLAYVVLDQLRVLDVRKPASPTLVGSYPVGVGSDKPGVFANGNTVYLADWQGLHIFQFTGSLTAARRWQGYR